MNKDKDNVKYFDNYISHKDLLAKIGEIDGITLRSIDEYSVAVILHIENKEIQLISDCGNSMDHHITRIGIAESLGRTQKLNFKGEVR